MKYGKATRNCTALVLALTLGACAFDSGHKDWNYDGSAQVELAQTEQYLPVLELSESGRILPYSAAPNPYALQEGKVDREAVDLYIEARRAFNRKDFTKAEELLSSLNRDWPGLSGPLVMRGDIALEREQPAEAVELYAQAIAINRENMNAWLRLAKAQRMQGHFRHAQNSYSRALAIWPDGAELHLNLGVLYDLYFNLPLKAQAHMEAYQLLSGDNSGPVVAWLEEVRGRTGRAMVLQTKSASESDRTAQNDTGSRNGLAESQGESDDELAASNMPLRPAEDEQ